MKSELPVSTDRKHTDKRHVPRRGVYVRDVITGVILCLTVLCGVGTVTAQDEAVVATAVPSTQAAQDIIQAVRDKELERALQSLGEVVDAQPMSDWGTDDGLSAAAGGLYRALVQQSTDEQYDLLFKWSIPGEDRSAVRLLTIPVPQSAPPSAFAREIGERPRDTSFPIAEINGVRGLFSTGWMLVTAAEDAGRLRRLIGELEPLAENNVPRADALLLLARLADARGDAGEMLKSLTPFAESLKTPNGETDGATCAALAAAALQHAELRSVSVDMLNTLVEQANGEDKSRLKAFLRVAHATAVQLQRGESGPEVLYENRLKYWVPASGQTALAEANGAADSMWLVHEDHVLHLAGSGDDALFFRYPLVGEFEFHCEAQEGGPMGTDGGLAYGGLRFEALGSNNTLTVRDADGLHPITRPCPFVRHEARPMFNRVGIRSTADGAVFLSNLHPVWRDVSAASSPWLGLRSHGDRRPIFRNLAISGNPVIPREVRLAEGNELRGWQAGFLGESRPAFVPVSLVAEPAAGEPIPLLQGDANEADWRIDDGVIVTDRSAVEAGTNPQSVLRYERPLLDGESITYEYFQEPEAYDVSPALGRLAFLIEPRGVRVHWITNGSLEWTGLAEGNAVQEPLSRRGPRTVPLKPDDWNSVTLARAEGTVTVSLNGTLIYERPVDFGGDHKFGLFHNRAETAVKVRDVVMTGDWPETLPEDCLANPAVVAAKQRPTTDRHALHDVAGSEFLAENVRAVRRHAAPLPAEERFAFLASWVLPDPDHPGLRLSGRFTQADPAPVTDDFRNARDTDRPHGSELVAPVFDLLSVARELGRLEELRQRIEKTPTTDVPEQQRAREALLLMVGLELENRDLAVASADQLYQLIVQSDPTSLAEMWPGTVAAEYGLKAEPGRTIVADVVAGLWASRVHRPLPFQHHLWEGHMAATAARQRHYQDGGTDESWNPTASLENWVPVTKTAEFTRGLGYAPAGWLQHEDGIHHVSGHYADFLYYRVPLLGNFEVECEIGGDGATQVLAAGHFIGPRWDRTHLDRGSFRKGFSFEQIDPPFTQLTEWIRYRGVFRDGEFTAYINGRPVHTEQLPEPRDPWFGVHGWLKGAARVRSLRITGDPRIPDAVPMSTSEQLTGWSSYHGETVGHDDAHWEFARTSEGDGGIFPKRRPELAGMFYESLLRYQRPLLEGGSIEYDFFHQSGDASVHPALDRLAFLIAPSGVDIHWITDGKFDPSSLPPDNRFQEPENRRASGPLPLKDGDWNHVQLSIAGKTVSLELNGQAIYERELETSNRRTFGLFRYAEADVRVRNVIMRGDWPKTLPEPSAYETLTQQVAELDESASKLKAVFTHDFVQDGLPTDYFRPLGDQSQNMPEVRPDGVFVQRPGLGKWAGTDVRLKFTLHGDFDVEAGFDNLVTESDKDSCIIMETQTDDDELHLYRLLRILTQAGRQQVHTSLSKMHPEGGRSYSSNVQVSCEAYAGRLRLARRGTTMYYLFAENDSPVFRLIGTEPCTEDPVQADGLRIRVLCNGFGKTEVVWKDVVLRAERMTLLPPEGSTPTRAMYLMNLDGGKPQLLTEAPEGFMHLGSPEWSADGRQLCFDASDGSTSSSHVFVIDQDGSNLKDLGKGCMPSLSADGRQIVCSVPSEGIVKLSVDGSQREILDRSGWGTQWSPDGRYVVWGQGSNMMLWDRKTDKRRSLLTDRQAAQVGHIYWNMGWSHDSRSVAFKGRGPAGGEAVFVVDIDSTEGFKGIWEAPRVNADFSWFPDHQRVLFAAAMPPKNRMTLVTVNRETADPPTVVPGVPDDWQVFDGDVSPDGRRIAFSALVPPVPVEWAQVTNVEN